MREASRKSPQLTVGLPVFNGMPFLPESLESLLTQTRRDFEILIVDDGSTDGTRDYLRTVSDRRVRVVHQEHRGLTPTLNRMLNEASTPWLVRHDSDDISLPNRIACMADAVNRYPQAAMLYTRAQHYQSNNKLGLLRTTEATPEELRSITRSGYLLAICHVSATLNVERVLSAGGYRFNLFIEDTDLWWRLALREDLIFIPETTVGVRLNPASICGRNFYEHAANTLYAQYLLISELRKQTPRPYSEVIEVVRKLVDVQTLTFRKDLREATVAFGDRRYLDAVTHALRAFTAAPARFSGRLVHGLRPGQPVRLGESPARFDHVADQLWRRGEVAVRPESGVCT